MMTISTSTSETGGWVFARRGFNDVQQGVTEADQFNTETVPWDEALVREATQNSQDARLRVTNGAVHVRIGLMDAGSGLDAALLTKVVSGLKPHLDAAGFEVSEQALRNPSALLIEDFGTEGLTGAIDDDLDTGNFRSFWFGHGWSYKMGTKNGRWGLGKLVFPLMSEGRFFLGLTIRHDDPRPLLLGQAVLTPHHIRRQRYAPHGHFGDASNEEHICPIADPAVIARFTKGFGLQRKDEPGLSVIVPYPRAGIDRASLLRFVVHNYAYPILTGRLTVDVLGTLVNADTIQTIGKDLLEPGLIQFILDVHRSDRASLVRVRARTFGERLTEQHVEADLPKLREDYAAGELIGFHVPVPLGRKKGPPLQSYVEVFVHRRFETEDAHALYVRGDITVPDEAARFKGAGVFAALLAQHEYVSEFLADAENPAHTKWQWNADRVSRNWKRTQETLVLIREALPALHRMLATGKDEEDPRALTAFFWIDDPEAPKEKGSGPKPKPKPGPNPQPIPPLPPAQRKVILTKRKGGFSIRPGPAFAEVALPAQLKVEVFYDVEVGKARWDALDFDLADGHITIETVGAVDESADNTILLTIEERDFSLTVEGFDEKRDLLVIYNVIKQKEAVDA
jgi:hypothetical protein